MPTDDALAGVGGDVAAVKSVFAEALQSVARESGLQGYEIPRDFLVETTPFTLENGLLTGIRKLARARSSRSLRRAGWSSCTSTSPTVRPTCCARCGATGPSARGRDRQPGRERAARDRRRRRGADSAFTDLGGDSLSALTFANLLHEIFEVDVPSA